MVAAIHHQTDEPLLAASAWIAAAHDVAWDHASDEEILEALVALPVLRNQLDALAGTLATAAERGAVQRDGSRKTSIWMGANTNASPTEVRHDIRTTKWLLDHAEFRNAYESGVLSRRHVDALRAAETPVTRLALIRDQEMLVDFADRLSFDDFGKALQYWINAADPNTPITPSFDDPNYRCEFLDGTPLHPQLAKALLGVAEFRRMILTADSRDLDISVNTRSFPQWMRDGRLVETRGRCTEHGCDAKFHWLHMDHRKPRAKGGQTNYRNLDPYCSEGNHAKADSWTEPGHDP